MNKRFISRAIVAVFALLISGSSCAFSRQFNASLGNALGLQNLGAKDVSQMFANGKVTNIYSNALTLVRNNEVKITFASIDKIMNNHPEFSSCNISADDVVNVLYESSSNFRSTLELTVIHTSKKKVAVPSSTDVAKSYGRFLLCRKGQTDFVDVSKYEDVSNILNKEYIEPVHATFNQDTIMQDNFGDDTFQNGTLDDGDYDLLVDIDKIGKKLFESFTTPVQTLFYELPTIASLTAGSNISSDGDSSSQPGGVFSILSGLQLTGVTGALPPDLPGLNGDTENRVGALDDFLATTDQGIQNFVNDANNQAFSPNDMYALPMSQCVTGIAADLSSSGKLALTVDEYEDFFQASIDALLVNTEDTTPQVPSITGGTGSTPAIYPSGTPNQRVEDAMDGIGGECGQHCNGLSEGEQQNCLNDCLKSCTAQCDDISITDTTDKEYCYSQCLCFTVSGPIGEKWKGMEDMYKIKFCTIPVQNNRVTGGKKVYSIEAIFKEIKNVLDSLLNGGEIIKRTKPKEFFDTSLSEIKFQDLFSFQITTQIKQIFPTISKSTQAKEFVQTNASYETAILGMTSNDKNKYIIVNRPIQDQVDAENIRDVDEYNARLSDLQNIEQDSTPFLPNVISHASNKNASNLNKGVRDFMNSHIDFWNFTSQALSDINDLVSLMKKAIGEKG